MDPIGRIVLGIIAAAFLSLFATFYLLEAQSAMNVAGEGQYLQGPIDIAAGITVFLMVLGFVILLLNRRMGASGYS